MRFSVFHGLTIPSTVVLVVLPAATSQAQVESTGFEASEGWDAGYSICGPEFAAACSQPVTDVCVPDDHTANQNCCQLDPNEDTGWYMSNESRHCLEPHIETANPYSGVQHLRFGRDPTLPLGYGAEASAIVSFPLPLEPRRTLISFRVAGASPPWSDLVFRAKRERAPFEEIGASMVLGSNGIIRIYDPTALTTVAAGAWQPGGGYKEVVVDLDPCNSVARYYYDGVLIHSAPYGEDRAREVGTLIFETANTPPTWDIDDVAVVYAGDSCGISCTAGPLPACGPGACASILAVAINGVLISPTGCVHVLPGDLIETELRISGWGPEMPLGVRDYQLKSFMTEAATGGASGLLLPDAWDAPLFPVPCSHDSDCPSEFPICGYLGCVGPDHDPDVGAYIDTSNPEFIFFGLDVLSAVDVSTLNYRFFSLNLAGIGVPDLGLSRYAGTLRLRASSDAHGSFVVSYDDRRDDCHLVDPLPDPLVVFPDLVPLVVKVCMDDGVFCNGLETFDPETGCTIAPPNCDDNNDCTTDSCNEAADSCDHVATCGACCDSWIGECRDAVDPIDCVCNNCIWTGGADCADVECEAQFVAIPAVSDWGLVILTLTLMVAAKIRFGRARAEPV